MNRRILPLLMLVCATTVGVLIGLNFSSPDLYIPANHSTSASHLNPGYGQVQTWRSSEDIIQIMSELMDDTGTVVLKIKLGDFETAEREFRQYLGEARNFDNLVVNLDLSETGIGEFNRYSQRNQELIRRLLDDSKRFEQLKSLQIQYREEKNPSALYSVTYEGEGLKTGIEEVTRQYNEQAPALSALGQQFNLNTTLYRQSVSDAEALAVETEAAQESRRTEAETLRRVSAPTAAPSGVDSLSLEVLPDRVTFGDTLHLTSWLNGRTVGGQVVDLYLDGERWASGRSDDGGRFLYDLRVERMRAERHVIYVAHEGVYSPVVNVTILPADAALTLDVQQESDTNVSVTGTLTAAGFPVKGAAVGILLDGYTLTGAVTQEGGIYRASAFLDPGQHTFQSAFEDSAFPLRATESGPVSLTVTEPLSLRTVITTIMIYATFLILFSMGAVVYYRHGKGGEPLFRFKNPFAFLKLPGRKDAPSGTGPEPAATPSPPPGGASPAPARAGEGAREKPAPSRDWILAQYRQLMIGGDVQNAVNSLYLFLRDQMARKYRIRDHRALTPRELWKVATNRPCFGDFTRFIHLYETVRYGGVELSREENESLVRLFEAASSAIESDSD